MWTQNQFSSRQAGSLALVAALLLPAFVLSLHAAEEVKVRHILVRKKATAEAAFAEVVNAGLTREAFVKAARKFSMDAVTKGAGGDLGWNTRSKFVPEFAEAAFDLQAGDMSEPVRSEFGWHIIFCEDRRETGSRRNPPPSPPSPVVPPQPETPKPETPKPPVKPSPSALVPPAATQTPTPGTGATSGASGNPTPTPTPVPTTPTPATPTPASPSPATPTAPTADGGSTTAEIKVERRIYIPPHRLNVVVESRRNKVTPSTALEVQITLQNQGQQDLKVFHPDLLPLGLKVRTDSTPENPPLDQNAIEKPSAFVIDLKSRSSVGRLFAIHDYFKDYSDNSRLWVSWDSRQFLSNFERRFPGESTKIVDFETAKTSFEGDGAKFSIDVKGLEKTMLRPYTRRSSELPIANYEAIASAKSYYAKFSIAGESQDLWFELDTKNQVQGVRQFVNLALQGFYDGLAFFDVKAESHLQGGCPRENGTGGPRTRNVPVSNRQKVSHEKGTLSLATIPAANGRGREAGSIFFISLAAHPEWDEYHVPIGRLVHGELALGRVSRKPRPTIKSVSIIPEARVPDSVKPRDDIADTEPAGPDGAPAVKTTTTGDPKVVLKTSKGDMTVELFYNDATNTVTNFITLVESGFFTKNGGNKILQRVDGYFLRLGSPDGTDNGRPDYRIASELTNNTKGHVAGTLTMCLEVLDGKPVPDTAGSQFMILLADIPFYNGLYTPFGRVTRGMDVLKQLGEGDTVNAIHILEKRQGQYTVTKLPLQ